MIIERKGGETKMVTTTVALMIYVYFVHRAVAVWGT